MKSSPASSASFASARQSSQLADQRSGTVVAERPDEQLAPNSPILSALSLYMAMRDCMDAAAGASTVLSSQEKVVIHHTTGFGWGVPTSPCGCHDGANYLTPPRGSSSCRRSTTVCGVAAMSLTRSASALAASQLVSSPMRRASSMYAGS